MRRARHYILRVIANSQILRKIGFASIGRTALPNQISRRPGELSFAGPLGVGSDGFVMIRRDPGRLCVGQSEVGLARSLCAGHEVEGREDDQGDQG